ncbi:MAG: oligosaccharide flippase family protein [Anaerolineales bacterium]|nr:oligosaccharide flippase family protein [Anaerolineales bacterium]MCB8989453.1 oligosaccharide flippase family protein [Ardenticatenaceae bacterium]MCB9005009.1 oligosaccharide flippase family protein [Ardenticatenaceae bacterium]
MSLARRTVTSISWNVLANVIGAVISFARSILLARWLPIEAFGVYTQAVSWVRLTVVFANFGMGAAFLHRATETEDEQVAASVHFTLKLIFVLVWGLALVVGAMTFAGGELRMAILWLALAVGGAELAQTPQLLLTRRVVHRRLALFQLLNVLLITAVSLILAWRGVALWALLATDLATFGLTIFLFYIWRPVWKPRLVWSKQVIRYYLYFGSRSLLAESLLRALNRIDDLWTGSYLGDTALGFYSRAYTFATYPRQLLASPINNVAGGTYAELKHDRRRLSQAFFSINALMIRAGFLLAGALALVAPEFILLGLGERWMPMLNAFRLMLVFTLLDPMKVTIANLYVAVGRPELVVKVRIIQVIVLVGGLFFLGNRWDITGVALAVDLMLVVGIAILLQQAKKFVDYKIVKLFLVPSLALVTALVVALGSSHLFDFSDLSWNTAVAKTIAFLTVYIGILLVGERQQMVQTISFLRKIVGR